VSREGPRRRDRSGRFETLGEGAPIHDIPERLHELGPHVEVLQVGRANPKAEGGSRAIQPTTYQTLRAFALTNW
jgi:hypothetical protein